MNLSDFLRLLTAAIIVSPFVCAHEEEGAVVVLTPVNFDTYVDGSKHALVEFYAPWCGHCKSLAPTYNELGKAFKGDKDILIAKVDADAHRELGTKFGIQGFPTLKWFPKGSTSPEDYGGGRSLEDFMAFIKEKTGVQGKVKPPPPSAALALTEETFAGVALNQSLNVLVEFYAPWCGHCKQLAPIYEKLATVFENEPHCIVAKVDADKHTELGGKYNIQGYPTLKFFAAGEEKKPVDYQAGRSLPDFVSYLNEKCGTYRTEAGRLKEEAGVVTEFLPLIRQWNAVVDASKLQQVKKSFVDMGTKLKSKAAPYYEEGISYYLKVLEKALKKGLDFPVKELARLERLFAQTESTLASSKVDHMILRMNILRSFAGTGRDIPVHEEL